jgi:hypothetical protein
VFDRLLLGQVFGCVFRLLHGQVCGGQFVIGTVLWVCVGQIFIGTGEWVGGGHTFIG